MPRRVKTEYVPNGHYARAAMDFLGRGAIGWNLPNRKSADRSGLNKQEVEGIKRMYGSGKLIEVILVTETDWTQKERLRIEMAFEKCLVGQSEASPRISLEIPSKEALREKAEFYRKEASVGASARKPRPTKPSTAQAPVKIRGL